MSNVFSANQIKMMQSIDKQIMGVKKKIERLSGNYLVNTYKRLKEQQARLKKKEALESDLHILEGVLLTIQKRELNDAEKGFMNSHIRQELFRLLPNDAPVFPEISDEFPEWHNNRVQEFQKRFRKYSISNTGDLTAAMEIFRGYANKEVSEDEQKKSEVSQLEMRYKLMQKGDIQFTPPDIAEKLVSMARITSESTVLEPSAGIGFIADAIKKISTNVDVIEQYSEFRDLLVLKGYNVVGNDFLCFSGKQYDAIIMNPPFSKNQDIEHLQHAMTLLKDGGTLVCIMSQHWTFSKDKKSQGFREWLTEQSHYLEKLDQGTFEATTIQSVIVCITK